MCVCVHGCVHVHLRVYVPAFVCDIIFQFLLYKPSAHHICELLYKSIPDLSVSCGSSRIVL